MALLLREILNLHDYALEQWGDPRFADWFLLGSMWPVIAISLCYLYLVLSLGPKLMENRNAFNIDSILIVYNAVQVIYCATLVIIASIYIIPYYNIFCEPCDNSMSPRSILTAHLAWWYFMIKIVDLLDTVFFVLRKKNNQVSFLHVYHHVGMVNLSWVGCRYVPSGATIYVGYANCIVHMAMYGYYLLSVWDKNYRNNLWWKKQITHLQLIQFGFITVLFSGMLLQKDCTFPRFISMFMIPQNLFMFVLFGDFYVKNYMSSSKSARRNKID